MKYKIYIILFILFCTFYDLRAKIYKRIDSEGDIHLYNEEYYSDSKKKFYKKKFKSKHNRLIEKISKEEKVDPYLIKCIIKVESNFDSEAVSDSGAMGLMQLMQETAEIYEVEDVFDPEENLRAGIKHFRFLLIRLDNNVPLALAAYHAGLGRVIKKRKIPPIKSTRKYVDKIMKLYKGDGWNKEKKGKLFKKVDKDGTIHIYSK